MINGSQGNNKKKNKPFDNEARGDEEARRRTENLVSYLQQQQQSVTSHFILYLFTLVLRLCLCLCVVCFVYVNDDDFRIAAWVLMKIITIFLFVVFFVCFIRCFE